MRARACPCLFFIAAPLSINPSGAETTACWPGFGLKRKMFAVIIFGSGTKRLKDYVFTHSE